MKAAFKMSEEEIFIVKEVPIPQIKPNEALIKVSACGLCGTDVNIRNNTFMGRHGRVIPPLVPGHEFVGIVTEIGPQVTKWKVGDRVFTQGAVGCGECKNCFTGKSGCRDWIHWGIDVDGGMAEYVAVHQNALYHVPDFIPDEHAAIMEIGSGATKAIRVNHIPSGSNIAIFGPGSYGLFLLQTTKLTNPVNHIMVGLSTDTERLEIAKQLGATHIILADKEDVVARIKEITDGQGVDFAIEATGNVDAVGMAIASLAGGGECIMGGSGFDGKNVTFQPWNFVRDSQKIVTNQGFRAPDYLMMQDLYASKLIDYTPIVSKVMSLDEINEACDLYKARKVIKIVIKP